MNNKTVSGRLREDGVKKIHELRDAYVLDEGGQVKLDAGGRGITKVPSKTYQAIAEALRVSLGTVYNVCQGRTWPDLHPDPAFRTT